MLWKYYEFIDDLVPLMEFTSEQFGLATREVFSGAVTQTEMIIEKHTKEDEPIEHQTDKGKATEDHKTATLIH